MKKLDVSSITDSARFPIKSGTLAFLQQAYGEALEGIIISLIGPTYNTTTMYVLSGCVNTGSGSNYTISGGYVFFNGEIYSVPSAGFSTTGTDVPVFVLYVGQFTVNADPVTFTDSSVKNVHNIRQVFVQSGASGSGLADYSAGVFMEFISGADVLKRNNTAAYSPTTAYNPATKKYVDDHIVSNLLWLGTVSADGTTVNKQSGTLTGITATKTATGTYTLTHNIGNQNYYISANGFDSSQPACSLRSYTPGNDTLVYHCSDDGSLNDCAVQIAIYSI
jgi:hypothetical protein